MTFAVEGDDLLGSTERTIGANQTVSVEVPVDTDQSDSDQNGMVRLTVGGSKVSEMSLGFNIVDPVTSIDTIGDEAVNGNDPVILQGSFSPNDITANTTIKSVVGADLSHTVTVLDPNTMQPLSEDLTDLDLGSSNIIQVDDNEVLLIQTKAEVNNARANARVAVQSEIVRVEGTNVVLSTNNDLIRKVDFVFFPNPVRDVLYISKNGVNQNVDRIEVISLNGTVVKQVENSSSIELLDLPQGSYIIRALQGTTFNQTMIVKW